MWSSRPVTACSLEQSGVWVDVPDTYLELVLANDVTSLISYSMVVVAAKPQLPGSSFLGEQRSNGGAKDFLQVYTMQEVVPVLGYDPASVRYTLLHEVAEVPQEAMLDGVHDGYNPCIPKWRLYCQGLVPAPGPGVCMLPTRKCIFGSVYVLTSPLLADGRCILSVHPVYATLVVHNTEIRTDMTHRFELIRAHRTFT